MRTMLQMDQRVWPALIVAARPALENGGKPLVYAVLWALLAAAAFAGSLYVFRAWPFQFKDQGAGPDYRPSAGVAGALMTVALLALVIALTV
ncbi:hypothetical protein D9M68_627220 [compost metagenome]|uniref:Uncharacterized protein n=1 Tax=Achromobacter agilis TaxID=1353888 RepID=A0A446CNQ8_9BURK|nr:hypothetical protein [Achromobacter agilis]SSW69353.1 hypothetical protein AGI3411_04159 [Achromobacter agilis]